jgi:hypothetical protein
LSPLRNGDVFVIGWSKSGSRRLQVRPRNPFSFTRFHYRVYALGRGDWIPPIEDWGAHASRSVSRVTVRRLAGQPCARSVTTRCCLRDDRLPTGRQFGLSTGTCARRGRRAPRPGIRPGECAPLLTRLRQGKYFAMLPTTEEVLTLVGSLLKLTDQVGSGNETLSRERADTRVEALRKVPANRQGRSHAFAS